MVTLALGDAAGCTRPNQAFGDDTDVGNSDAGSSDAGNSDAENSDASPSSTSTDGGPVDGTGNAGSGASTLPGDGTTSGASPLCGNELVEGDELCDDGNADETDACTTLCEPPRCDDGLHSGQETDVDCGGPQCDACAVGDGCSDTTDCAIGLLCDPETESCLPPASCLEHQQLDGNAPTGVYEIDPLSDGRTLSVFCEMDENGGGWTRLLDHTFDAIDGEWSPWWTFECGPNDALGPLGAGEDAIRELELLGVTHTEAWVSVGYFMIDDWDPGEYAYVDLDGVEVIATPYPAGIDTGDLCGWQSDDRYNEMWGFGVHGADTVQIAIGATLDEALEDESLGVNAVSFYVR